MQQPWRKTPTRCVWPRATDIWMKCGACCRFRIRVCNYQPLKWAVQYGYSEMMAELIPVSNIHRQGVLHECIEQAAVHGNAQCLDILLPYYAAALPSDVDINTIFKRTRIFVFLHFSHTRRSFLSGVCEHCGQTLALGSVQTVLNFSKTLRSRSLNNVYHCFIFFA